MNKKMILLGVAALVGCFALTSFDKKTLAQQKEEIAEAVTAQLDSLKAEKATACTETVMAEATIRYNTWVEEENAKPAVGGKKRVIKKATPSGPKVDPLPEVVTPTPTPADPVKSKMEGDRGAEDVKAKMEGDRGAEDVKSKMKRKSGGN